MDDREQFFVSIKDSRTDEKVPVFVKLGRNTRASTAYPAKDGQFHSITVLVASRENEFLRNVENSLENTRIGNMRYLNYDSFVGRCVQAFKCEEDFSSECTKTGSGEIVIKLFDTQNLFSEIVCRSEKDNNAKKEFFKEVCALHQGVYTREIEIEEQKKELIQLRKERNIILEKFEKEEEQTLHGLKKILNEAKDKRDFMIKERDRYDEILEGLKQRKAMEKKEKMVDEEEEEEEEEEEIQVRNPSPLFQHDSQQDRGFIDASLGIDDALDDFL